MADSACTPEIGEIRTHCAPSWQSTACVCRRLNALHGSQDPLDVRPRRQTVEDCTAIINGGGNVWGQGSEATLIDFHIARCHAVDNCGGMFVYSSSRATMTRGSVTACTAGLLGGGLRIKGTLSLMGTLIAECATTGQDSDSRGGGIQVDGATVHMTGGALVDCDSYEGGGLMISGAGVQAHLSSVAVRGCNAHNEGGGLKIEAGDVSLVDVGIEDCVAHQSGGGLSTTTGLSTVHAVRVRIARCHASQNAGGAATLLSTSTWTDCTFSDCRSSYSNVNVFDGTNTFLRCSILRCRALGLGAMAGIGGGLGVPGGYAMMIDSIVSGCSARDSGGCIRLSGTATLILRNTTLSSCLAPEGPFMSLQSAAAATALVSELLALEPSCEEEHSGALIAVTDDFTSPLDVRGLQVHACASSNPSVLSEHVRLSHCSDGDVCGAAATCADVLPLPSAPNLTTVDCSCQGEFFPSPEAASAAGTSLSLAPYGFDPSIDYCVSWFRLESAQWQVCTSHAMAPLKCRSRRASPPRPRLAASLSRR